MVHRQSSTFYSIGKAPRREESGFGLTKSGQCYNI